MIGEDEIISDVSAIKEAASMDFFFFFLRYDFLGGTPGARPESVVQQADCL